MNLTPENTKDMNGQFQTICGIVIGVSIKASGIVSLQMIEAER